MPAGSVADYHCEECRRAFSFAVLIDNPNHWSKPGDRPVYCPCCGSFDAIKHGIDIPATSCRLDVEPSN